MAKFVRSRGTEHLELVIEGTELIETTAFGEARQAVHDTRAAQIAYYLRIGEILDTGWWRTSSFSEDLVVTAPLPFIPDNDAGHAVLRDALLERGDARGELAVLRTTAVPDERAIGSLEKTRGLELFGPFAFLPRAWRMQIAFGWRGGWIDEIVATDPHSGARLFEILHAALHAPMACFARTLTTDIPYEVALEDIAPCACLDKLTHRLQG